MMSELIGKTLRLIKEFYILEKKFSDLDLQYINLVDDGFILKDTISDREEVWRFYNIGEFIDIKIDSILDKNIEKRDRKIEEENIYKDLVLLEKEEWIKKYGEILYSKERINCIKKDLKNIEKIWQSYIKEDYILEMRGKEFDLKILLEDVLYKKNLKIDNENLIIARLNGKIMKLGNDKTKIINELIWTKDNIKKGILEIVIPFDERENKYIKIKLEKSILKTSLCRYLKDNYSIEYLKLLDDEKIKILNYFNDLNKA